MLALNDTLNEIDLIDIYRTFHPKQQNTTAHRTSSRTDHMLGHKTNLKFKNFEII